MTVGVAVDSPLLDMTDSYTDYSAPHEFDFEVENVRCVHLEVIEADQNEDRSLVVETLVPNVAGIHKGHSSSTQNYQELPQCLLESCPDNNPSAAHNVDPAHWN